MQRLLLPIVRSEASFDDAVEVMRAAGATAFVQPLMGGGHGVVTFDDLLAAHRAGTKPLPTPSLDWIGRTPDLLADPVQIEAELDANASTTAVTNVVQSAEVITRHEHIALTYLGSIMLCRCTANARHVFRPEELIRAGQCNLDSATVVCS